MGEPAAVMRLGGVDESPTAFVDRLADSRLEPEAILTSVLTALSRVRSGTWLASLMNKDPRTMRLVVANQGDPLLSRYIEDMYAAGVGFERNLTMRVIDTGEPLILQSVAADAFVQMLDPDVRTYLADKTPPLSSPATIAGVLVPMRARGATIGTLGVFDAAPGARFGKPDADWLQDVADRTGLALENAQLYADAAIRHGRLDALHSIGLAMSGSPDLRLSLQVILDHVRSGLGVDAADVMLLDEAGGTLYMAAQAGYQSTSIPDYRLPVDDKLPGRLMSRAHAEPVVEQSAFAQFRRRTLFAREGFRAYCAAPLVARGRPIGVLEVLHRSVLQPDAEWLAFLEALAAYAAIAIDSARMHQRLETSVRPGRGEGGRAPRLSPLEREILSLLVEGTTNSAIALAVHLSQSTVKFHVRQILQKVGAGNRTELARVATREGWL